MTENEKLRLVDWLQKLQRSLRWIGEDPKVIEHVTFLKHCEEWVGSTLRGPTQFQLKDKVEKIKGYKFPGTIIMTGFTSKNEFRVVVECNVPEVDGILHVYAPEQLRLVDAS